MHQSKKESPVRAFCEAAIFGLAFLLFSGYQYGVNNAHEGNQLARRLMNSDYLAHDWYTNTVSGTSVRMASSWVLAKLGLLFGLEGASWLLYCCLAIAMGCAVYFLAHTLFPSPLLAAMLAIGVQNPTPGLAHLWMNTLEAQSFAMPFALFGLTFSLRGRWRLAGLAFGIATLFHHLIGIEFLLLAGLGAFFLKPRADELFQSALIFLAFGGLNLYFLLSNVFSHRVPGKLALEILTVYRNPWHYLPFVGQLGLCYSFFGLVLLGAIFWWPFRNQAAHRAVASWMMAMIILMLLAIPFTLLPFPLFIKMQFYRLAPFAQALIYLYIGGGLMNEINKRLVLPRLPGLLSPFALAALVLIADAQSSLALGHHFLPGGWPRFSVRLQDLPKDEWMEACTWIGQHTEKEGIFLSPPEPEGFRTYAERATVVDFKNFVFMDDEMLEWHRRMANVSGIDAFSRETWERRSALRDGFLKLTPERIRTLQGCYRARYLLTERSDLPFSRLHRNARYSVYDLKAHSDQSENLLKSSPSCPMRRISPSSATMPSASKSMAWSFSASSSLNSRL